MATRALHLVARANYMAAACIAAGALYLLSMPLHPPAGDAHGGLLAAFSGLLLLPAALIPYAAGRLVQRGSRAAWLAQVLALVVVAALVALLLAKARGVA